jgi:hypothetical protein
MKISGHKDARFFARYNIVDTRDVGEAMRKLVECEQEKRLARAKRVQDVHTSFTEAEKPALPAPLQ